MNVYEAIGPKIASEDVAVFSFYLLSIVFHVTATLQFSGLADAFIITLTRKVVYTKLQMYKF